MNETIGDSFEVIKCKKCNSKKVQITDFDSHNEVWRFKCEECGHEFTKPIT